MTQYNYGTALSDTKFSKFQLKVGQIDLTMLLGG